MKLGIWRSFARKLMALVVLLGLTVGCGPTMVDESSGLPVNPPPQSLTPRASVAVTGSPAVIATLDEVLAAAEPEVTILSPRPDEVLSDTTARVRIRVENLTIYMNDVFRLGPHVQVQLDNQPSTSVYDTSEPLDLADLSPGTHTLRVLAAKPWQESFKNRGALAQVTFHVLAKTGENQPTLGQPALIYSQPEGSYGAEPVLLDFHLSDLPLHMIAQESDLDAIKDWHLRCTVNGESLRIDTWEPVYLTGLKPGRNWVQLVLEDEDDQPIVNTFNNTVRLIDYQPGGTDGLSRLMRGELTPAEVMGIVDPNYVPPEPEIPEPEVPEPDIVSPSDSTMDSSENDVEPDSSSATDREPSAAAEPDRGLQRASSEEVPDEQPLDEKTLDEKIPDEQTLESQAQDDSASPLAPEPELSDLTLDDSEATLTSGQDEFSGGLEPPGPIMPGTRLNEPLDSFGLLDESAAAVDVEQMPDPLDPVEEMPSISDPASTLPGEAIEAETLDSAIEDLTLMDGEPSMPAISDSQDVPDSTTNLEDDNAEGVAEPQVEQEVDSKAGQRLFRRLYDYRDRSLEKYGNR